MQSKRSREPCLLQRRILHDGFQSLGHGLALFIHQLHCLHPQLKLETQDNRPGWAARNRILAMRTGQTEPRNLVPQDKLHEPSKVLQLQAMQPGLGPKACTHAKPSVGLHLHDPPVSLRVVRHVQLLHCLSDAHMSTRVHG